MWFHQSGNSLEENSKQCINASLSIMKQVKHLNEQIKKKLHINLNIEIGIGAACGTAIVGLFGAPKHRIQYSVIGPPVNLAGRLCSEAKANEILIGGKIIEYCLHSKNPIGFRTIKGFDHEVELMSINTPASTPEVNISYQWSSSGNSTMKR